MVTRGDAWVAVLAAISKKGRQRAEPGRRARPVLSPGYGGDVAAAAVTREGGHGGAAAGPIVAAVVRAGAEGGG
ncbi:hypothetical protein ACFO9E_05530 [Streptomyces maoxianensis]|uniref:Uncharacterized protein n=1 Tax=Streptomyces maoxianensis TaxID=1459942 RepID=A0ABV9FYY1_9ACTN